MSYRLEEKGPLGDKEKDSLNNVNVDILSPVADDTADQIAGQNHIHATEAEIQLAESQIDTMPVERARKVLSNLVLMHKHDQNFDLDTLTQIEMFLDNPDVEANPEKHEDLIHAMRLEALLVTNNSPYAMVRGTVDVEDDPSLPTITFRAMLLGTLACGIGSAINQIFSIRYPGIGLGSHVIQLLAYPLGTFLARILPEHQFNINFFGRRTSFSLNPGPFNRKEHMLITIMSVAGMGSPYTTNIIFVQALPKWYGQTWAMDVGYQMLNTLGCNFAGIGMAGLCRSFLVHPSYCVWPGILATLSLNRGFHQDDVGPVAGPRRKMYSWSRMKLFYIAFIAMFFYFWLPNTFFTKLTFFNWIGWIDPNNVNLTRWTSTYSGIGLNPFPTFDWNNGAGITSPAFSVNNGFFGAFLLLFVLLGFYYSNAFNCGYLPMMNNGTFDNTGASYKVRKILGPNGRLDMAKYQQYSEPYMTASSITQYLFFFAKYTAVVAYIPIYHGREIGLGFKMLWRNLKKSFSKNKEVEEIDADALGEDIHFRLMRVYKEVPEWWYLLVLVFSLVVGMLGVGLWPSETTPAVVIYGVIMSFIFVIPLGIVQAITGSAPTLNVLAEFIGGCFDPGNALQMNYFKMYGYVTAANAIGFTADMKLGHYTKIRPRDTFWVQIWGTLVNSFITASILNFQMSLKDVCDLEKAPFRFFCMGQTTFYTATVFWGSLGPNMIFGANGRYKWLCLGFLVGPVMVGIIWLLQRKWPRSKLLRSLHPIAILTGTGWYPTNLSNWWTNYVTTWVSWNYIKPRYLGFWSKYNFILSVGLDCGIAISGIIQFLVIGFLPDGVGFPTWWGNADEEGCNKRGNINCTLLHIPKDPGYFGPPPGSFT